MSNLLFLALEAEDTSGVANQEIEHVIYARVENFDFLKDAAEKEVQEQWQIKTPKTDKNAAEALMRVRATTVFAKTDEAGNIISNTERTFALTNKVRSGEGRSEVTIACTEDMFTQFKLAAENGMFKCRYVFPVAGTDLKFEVDVYYKSDSWPRTATPEEIFHPWVKIDLEVPSLATEIPPLPFIAAEVIDRSKGQLTEEQEGKITHLYETVFLTKNRFINKPA